jgi:hypothetical protein
MSGFQQIVGGVAGGEGAFKKTQVGLGDRSGSAALAACHRFSTLARTPLYLGSDGSLSCAAAIPPGANGAFLDGEVSSMVTEVGGGAGCQEKSYRRESGGGHTLRLCLLWHDFEGLIPTTD